MLPRNLDPAEVRVLGSLIEKELTTPDHYPLSLNSLVSACNQSSNREPVTSLASSTVSGAIDTLRRQDLVRSFQGSGERVPKYQHLLATAGEVSRAELAVLGVLMLRGPQTLAEVRARAARMMTDDDPDVIEAALERLIAREPEPAAVRLPRRAGQKELRYAHLLGGDVIVDVVVEERDELSVAAPASIAARIATLEALMQEVQLEMSDLRAQFEGFRRQFE
ncbi:YceH family protein [soil metagenome]